MNVLFGALGIFIAVVCGALAYGAASQEGGLPAAIFSGFIALVGVVCVITAIRNAVKKQA